MARSHYAGQTLTATDLTAARVAGAAQGYANRNRSGSVTIPNIGGGTVPSSSSGRGIATAVVFDDDVPGVEMQAAEQAVAARFSDAAEPRSDEEGRSPSLVSGGLPVGHAPVGGQVGAR